MYTKTRRSELPALTAADVDLAHDTISISKQAARTRKKAARDVPSTKKTKTKRSRTIDLEPHLRPLVELLIARPEGREERLFRVPPSEDYAELFRKDLWTVGARDARLHTEDASRTRMTGHCLRDTGLTHMAVRGDSPIVIQWCGGHTDFKMTQSYLDRGRNDARRIGEPLPPLPPELLAGPPGSPTGFGSGFGTVQTHGPKLPVTIGNFATPTGIEDPFPQSRSARLRTRAAGPVVGASLRAFAASSDIGLLASRGRRSPPCSYQAAAKGKCRGSGEDNAPERLVNDCSPRVMVSRSPTRHPALTAPADPG